MDETIDQIRAPKTRRQAPRRLAMAVAAIGAAGLIGWALGLDLLTRLSPGLITMKPNAALGLLLAGASLWWLRDDARSRRVAMVLAMAVLAIGGLTLLEYTSGIDLGIDEILAGVPPDSFGALHGGRMHPTSAFNLVMVGMAVGLLAAGRGVGMAQILALLALMVAGSALIGYLYGEREFLGIAAFNQMALHTSVAFILMAAAILGFRSDQGIMAAITSDSAGGLMARRLLPFAIFVPITLHGLTLMGQRAGLFDEKFGAAVRVTLGVAVFFVVISQAAQSLHRLDLDRRRAAGDLRAAFGELESRIAQQAAIEADLRASEERYRFLADAMPQIVWTSRPNGEANYFNRRSEEYSGRSFENFLGYGWKNATHQDDQAKTFALWRRSVRTGVPFEAEFRIRRELDGSYRWHLGRAVPMRDESGAIVLWIGTCTDINDQKRSAEELRLAHEELEARVLDRTAALAAANAELQHEIGERQKVEQELRRGELRNRSLIEATTAIVWNTPASGEFETEQPGWSAYTGQSFEQLRGWGWLDAIHPDDRPETALVWSDAVESRSPYEVTHRIRRHDGVYRYAMVRAIPILNEEGAIEEWIGVHTDIDAQTRAQDAMREAREAAEASTRAKSEFLANMSHEIRTPMNGILGMTELALDTDLSPQQREYLGLVKSSAEALLIVINDILDFSKIEAGKLRLDPVPFGLRDCIEGTLKTLALRAHDKRLELSCRVAPDVPDGLIGDACRLRQIVVNLVGNAIKFTDHGEVAVSIEGEPAGGDLKLHVAVRDTGVGIPIAKQAAIFEPFEQADGSTTRTHGGTGLGLAISTKLVELMGGRIWVESEPEVGSTFHFTAEFGLQPGVSASSHLGDPELLSDLPILVVDDNGTNRRILEELVASWGARPTSVDSGPAALQAMRIASQSAQPFRVVLLDGVMPGLDGYGVAEEIAADPALATAMVVLLTSNDLRDNRAQARSAGIAARLTKPVRQSELFELLISRLNAGGSSLGAEGGPGAIEPSNSGPSYAILLAEDHVVNQKVVTMMLKKRGHRFRVANDGRQALAAVREESFDLVLMDVQMPEMDGFEAVAAIRADERRSGGRRLPIIALTAHAMQGDRDRCLDSGFDAYVAKPIRSELLFQTINHVMSPSEQAGTSMVDRSQPPFVFDLESAMECTGGNEPLFREVLQLFLDDCPRLLDEIDLAMITNDPRLMSRAAHTIKGTAGHFAAHEVVAAADRLEMAALEGRFESAGSDRSALVAALDRFFQALGDLKPRVAPWHRSAVSTQEPQPCP